MRKINKFRIGPSAVICAVLLTGCANFHKETAVTNATFKTAKSDLPLMRQPLPKQDIGRFITSSGVWTSDVAVVSHHGLPLPPAVEMGHGEILTSPTSMDLVQIASFVSKKTGIPVVLSNSLLGGAHKASAAPASPVHRFLPMPQPAEAINQTLAQANGGHSPAKSSTPAVPPLPSAASVFDASYATTGKMAVKFAGPLSQFLDMVSERFGVSWTYNGGQIRIFRNETRTWTINALPTQQSESLSMSSSNSLASSSSTGGGGGGGGGGSTGSSLSGTYSTTSTSKMSINVWGDILTGVKNIVGKTGTVTASESTGSLTVSAPAPIVTKVASFIRNENSRLSHMVAVSIHVISVTATRGDNYNFSLNQVLSNLSHAGAYSFNIGNSAAAAASAASSLSSSTPGVAFGVLSPTSGVSGTSAIATALSQIGKVSTVYDTAVTTMSGIPAPLQVSQSQAYLQSVSTTNLGGTTGGTQQQLTPGTVTTGVSFEITPRVDPGRDGVLLNYAMTISALTGPDGGFKTISSGGQTIQLPVIQSQQFSNQAELKSGDTVILAGYNEVSDNVNHTGTGNPYNFLLGGSANATHTNQIILLLLTPVVVKTPSLITESGN